tara:strand:- start:7029 stop:7964 length:936 start_codon:yes stop_codon:yes gene_type:complete
MSPQLKIAVLLSTYNGEKFLREQLDSLLAQSHENFILVVRDDGSHDGTVSILESYARDYSERIRLLPRDGENKGASAGFAFLVDYILKNKETLGLNSAYMMFCDQDDIWYPQKIEKQLSLMLKTEADYDSTLPILVHSDLEVVSEQNTAIAKSLINYQGLDVERNSFPNLLTNNLVTGCATLINQSLAEKALPIPGAAVMHDWWLALVAAAFGKVVYLDIPLVHYRQHKNNTFGAKEHTKASVVSMSFWRRMPSRESNEYLSEVSVQAAEFHSLYGLQLSVRERLSLQLCMAMGAKSGIVQHLMYRLARRL